MIASIHRIGKVMGLKTIAEFVEREQAFDKPREIAGISLKEKLSASLIHLAYHASLKSAVSPILPLAKRHWQRSCGSKPYV